MTEEIKRNKKSINGLICIVDTGKEMQHATIP